jgi:chromosome segregation ATPase
MDWNKENIALLVAISAVLIPVLIPVLIRGLSFVTVRLDARKARLAAAETNRIADSIEVRKLEADTETRGNDSLVANLWKFIAEKDAEIAELKKEIEECEAAAKLNRPTINKIYAKLRAMRTEIESLNVMVLNEEETNVFMRRFNQVKLLLDETEGLLP